MTNTALVDIDLRAWSIKKPPVFCRGQERYNLKLVLLFDVLLEHAIPIGMA